MAGVSQSGAPARFGGGRPFALVGRFASSRWVASHPPQTQYQTQYIYLEVEYIYISKRNIYLEVNTTSNMVHQLTDIYIPHAHAYSPRTIGGWGAPWWVTPGGVPGGWRPNPRPKDQSRDFTIFQTTKSSKNGNVTQLLKKVAQFVWCFGRARTTPIQKLSPAAFSSHFNCTFSFYTPNGVGEYV